jgi:hypothetical protein
LQAIKHYKSERDTVYLINVVKKHKNLISSQNHFKILTKYKAKKYLIQNIIIELKFCQDYAHGYAYGYVYGYAMVMLTVMLTVMENISNI